jgi:hypothetical protein
MDVLDLKAVTYRREPWDSPPKLETRRIRPPACEADGHREGARQSLLSSLRSTAFDGAAPKVARSARSDEIRFVMASAFSEPARHGRQCQHAVPHHLQVCASRSSTASRRRFQPAGRGRRLDCDGLFSHPMTSPDDDRTEHSVSVLSPVQTWGSRSAFRRLLIASRAGAE